MKKQSVVVVTSYYVNLYVVHGSGVSRVLRVGVDDEGFKALERNIRENPLGPVRILANLYDEEFIFIRTPHVNPWERRRLLKRKLQQQFRKHEYKRYYYQGRETEGRKDDSVMLSSLGSCEVIGRLVDVLFDASVPISGIFSVQSMYKSYLEPLMDGRDVLIMTEIDNGNPSRVAVRQSYYKSGNLKLSRVANIYVSDEEAFREDVKEELETSRLFLIREHYIEEGYQLPVVFVHSTDYLQQLSSQEDSMGEHFRLEHISAVDLAAMLNIECEFDDIKFEEISAVGSLATHSESHYESVRSNYHYRHYSISRLLKFGAVATLVTSLITSGGFIYGGYHNENAAALKENAASIADRSVRESKAKIEHFAENITDVQAAVDFINELEVKQLAVDDLLNQVGRVLADYPNIKLGRMNWSVSTEEVDQDESDMAWDMNEDGEFIDDMSMEDVVDDERKYTVEIQAYPEFVGTNVRKIMTDVDRLAETLGEIAQVNSAFVTEYPFNLEGNSELKGKVANSEYVSLSENTDFKIELEYSNGKG